jgi:hypothetical protein
MQIASEPEKSLKKVAIKSDLQKTFPRLRIAVVTPPHEHNAAQFNRTSDRASSGRKKRRSARRAPTYSYIEIKSARPEASAFVV